MWIRTATDKNAVHLAAPLAFSYIEGSGTLEYYFDEETAQILEQAGFLSEMWNKFDAVFDWGDCDFFLPDKCKLLKEWLQQQLSKDIPKTLKSIYTIMLNYTETAIRYNTGISFDF